MSPSIILRRSRIKGREERQVDVKGTKLISFCSSFSSPRRAHTHDHDHDHANHTHSHSESTTSYADAVKAPRSYGATESTVVAPHSHDDHSHAHGEEGHFHSHDEEEGGDGHAGHSHGNMNMKGSFDLGSLFTLRRRARKLTLAFASLSSLQVSSFTCSEMLSETLESLPVVSSSGSARDTGGST